MVERVVRFPVQRPGVHVQRDETGALLVDDGVGQAYRVNETALALWELCDGATAPEEMVDAVRIACGVARDVAELDISRALRELTDAGLLAWGATGG